MVTGLTNGLAYDFKVSAINGIGTGTASNVASATPSTIPSAIADLTATAGNTQVTLSWTAPNNGGSSITDYIIQYKLSTVEAYTTFSDGTSTTASAMVTGLTNGLAYDFKVSAINGIGTGTASNVASATTNTNSFTLSSSGTATLKKAVTTGTNLFAKGPYTISVEITADIDSVSAGVPKLSHIAGTFSIDGANNLQDVTDHLFTNLKLVIPKDLKSIKWIAEEGSGQLKFLKPVDFKKKTDQTAGNKSTIAKIVLSKATFTPKVSTSNIDFN
jgi:hypothetical protein